MRMPPESTLYDDLVAVTQINKIARQKAQAKSTRKVGATTSAEPKNLLIKVHLEDQQACDEFAQLIQRNLNSREKKIAYTHKQGSTAKKYSFTDLRSNVAARLPSSNRKKAIRGYDDFYDRHWRQMPEFSENGDPPFFTINFTFKSVSQLANFARLVKQRITQKTKYIYFPDKERDDLEPLRWASNQKKKMRYPVYIISKGRAQTRLTARTLEELKIPYFMVIEKQDYDAYSTVIDPKQILVLPFEGNHKQGPGRARNWCWDHAVANGHEKHWVLDDNIAGFYRLHENRRIKVADNAIFRAAEDFVDRYKNVLIAGFQYRFFIPSRAKRPPFIKNTRIYSVLLIDHQCKHRWRGKYNEDTILSLDVLKDGDCTVLFSSFLAGKAGTQTLSGGNTDEFYKQEGTYKKSLMLKLLFPDDVKMVGRYKRDHHEVNYGRYWDNLMRLKVKSPMLKKVDNEYGMKLMAKRGS